MAVGPRSLAVGGGGNGAARCPPSMRSVREKAARATVPARAPDFRNLCWRAGYSDFSRCAMLGNNPASSITL
ncbi:hypothetical protein GCM10017083_43680 [Thalassobaculum fulvum]|uniref:Uncharacterized protein n=1 Tax=Thalassobaculum fulvum TaxID=1633335 RepID=A0A919CST2_9PROT|nr:hypothetical protein GCM10017083_43680 [Thalassobaculum fulvum]